MSSGPDRAGQHEHRAVLYIEDRADNIRLVERLLKRRRPQTPLLVVTNGHDGVKAAVDQQPALILLDNRLPDATGGEVLHQLISCPVTAGIPVVIVSGDSGKLIADELLANGAAAFLAKPFDIHALLNLIDHYLL
jgi:CheY-like chemotaxis protein